MINTIEYNDDFSLNTLPTRRIGLPRIEVERESNESNDIMIQDQTLHDWQNCHSIPHSYRNAPTLLSPPTRHSPFANNVRRHSPVAKNVRRSHSPDGRQLYGRESYGEPLFGRLSYGSYGRPSYESYGRPSYESNGRPSFDRIRSKSQGRVHSRAESHNSHSRTQSTTRQGFYKIRSSSSFDSFYTPSNRSRQKTPRRLSIVNTGMAYFAVSKGRLEIVRKNRLTHSCFFEVFSNRLIKWGPKETHFKNYRHSAMIQKVNADSSNVKKFHIMTNFKAFTLMAPDEETKKRWVRDIERLLGEEYDYEGEQSLQLDIDAPLVKRYLQIIHISSKGVTSKPKRMFFQLYPNCLLVWGKEKTEFNKYEHSATIIDVSLAVPKEICIPLERQSRFFILHTNNMPLYLIAPNLIATAQWLNIATNLTRNKVDQNKAYQPLDEYQEKIYEVADIIISIIKSLLIFKKKNNEADREIEGHEEETKAPREYLSSSNIKTVVSATDFNVRLLVDLYKELQLKCQLTEQEIQQTTEALEIIQEEIQQKQNEKKELQTSFSEMEFSQIQLQASQAQIERERDRFLNQFQILERTVNEQKKGISTYESEWLKTKSILQEKLKKTNEDKMPEILGCGGLDSIVKESRLETQNEIIESLRAQIAEVKKETKTLQKELSLR